MLRGCLSDVDVKLGKSTKFLIEIVYTYLLHSGCIRYNKLTKISEYLFILIIKSNDYSKFKRNIKSIANAYNIKRIRSEYFHPYLPPEKARALKRTVDGKSSHWLNVVPKTIDNFDLSPDQF